MDAHQLNTFEAQDRIDESLGWNRDAVADTAKYLYETAKREKIIKDYASNVGARVAGHYNFHELDCDEITDATDLGYARLEYERQQRTQLYIAKIAGIGFADSDMGLSRDVAEYIEYARQESAHPDNNPAVDQLFVEEFTRETIKEMFKKKVTIETIKETDVLNNRFGVPKSPKAIAKKYLRR